jgi:hypothetical protein
LQACGIPEKMKVRATLQKIQNRRNIKKPKMPC